MRYHIKRRTDDQFSDLDFSFDRLFRRRMPDLVE